MDMYVIFALLAFILLIQVRVVQGSGRRCLHPKDGGVYRRYGIALRYYYDAIGSKRCRSFLFSGSGGNSNNFISEQDCEDECTYSTALCVLPKQEGNGTGHHLRFYYDPSIRACERFYYTGSNGNANKFQRLSDCNSRCKRNLRTVCSLRVMNIGYCLTDPQPWFHNHLSGRCEAIRQGGCNGDDNRFETQEECELTCGRPTRH